MEIPVYNVTLNDYDAGVFAISLVDKPAIESDFIYMSKEDVKDLFLFSDKEKGEVVGAILIPDLKIYRKDSEGNEYFVVFSKEVIEEINQRMHETGFNKYFSVAHEMDVRGSVKFLESWIKETDEDKSSAFGINVPTGSLLIKAKIDSEFIKKNIKGGNLNGFSVEIQNSLIQTNLHKQEKQGMNYKELYPNSIVVDGVELIFSSEKLDKGVILFSVVDEKLTSYTGNFKIENVKYEVKDGLVTEVENIELSIQEKVDSLINTVASLTKKLEETSGVEEGTVTISEQLTSIMTSLAEQKLQDAQKTEQEDAKVNLVENFNANDYKSASDWIKKWY